MAEQGAEQDTPVVENDIKAEIGEQEASPIAENIVPQDSKVEKEEEIQFVACPTGSTAPFTNRSKQNYYSPLALNKMECWMCGMSHKRRRKFKHSRRAIVDSWLPTEQEVAPAAQAN